MFGDNGINAFKSINQSVNKYTYKEINKYRHHVEEYEVLHLVMHSLRRKLKYS